MCVCVCVCVCLGVCACVCVCVCLCVCVGGGLFRCVSVRIREVALVSIFVCIMLENFSKHL